MPEIKITLLGKPVTKKNSQRIITRLYPRILQSKAYLKYEDDCLSQLYGYQHRRLKVTLTLIASGGHKWD